MKFPQVLAVAIALAAPSGWALDTAKLKPTGYVNDFANVIPASAAQSIEAYCANVERVTGVQMAVVTVESLEDEPIEDVAARLYREWGIGKKGMDEGILLMLSIKDRKTRAEVGYGLEPIITDARAGDALRAMRQVLRQGDYGGAVAAALVQIGGLIAQAKGVELGGAQPQRGRPAQPELTIPFPLVIIGFLLLMWLMNRGGRGGGTGLLAGMLLGNMMGRRGGWGGGGFGGYDGGGGGGGGFGGFGGGSSGGGGASGDW